MYCTNPGKPKYILRKFVYYQTVIDINNYDHNLMHKNTDDF